MTTTLNHWKLNFLEKANESDVEQSVAQREQLPSGMRLLAADVDPDGPAGEPSRLESHSG